MNIQEAREILRRHLDRYRGQSYADLVRLIQEQDMSEVAGASGTSYQIEIQAVWDQPSKPQGNIRVLGSIDDGGWWANVPLCDDFIMAPDGSFVGE